MFDKSRFMEYLKENYGELDETALSLVEGMIDYAMKVHGHNKYGTTDIVYDVMKNATYIDPQEIEQFDW